MKLAADIDIVHVPYRGAAPALNDLQAGQVQGMFTSTASVAPMVAGSRLRPLAVTTPPLAAHARRARPWPRPAGPTAEVVVWAGIMAPAGVPRTIVRKLERAFVEAALAPEVRDRLVRLGADPVGRGAREASPR